MVVYTSASGQIASSSNVKRKKVAVVPTLRIDSLSIVPNTFLISGVDTGSYTIDLVNSVLTWKQQPVLDSVHITYRVFPYRFNEVARRFTYDSVMNNFIRQPEIFSRGKKAAMNPLFNFGTMNYNGSFGRALSFGNTQDVVVNSQFNLQLSGLIGDSIRVAAAITDNNIPIQPDGTTQQLNEFDRVWLQFKKHGWEVNLGDIDIRQNRSYFLNFYKRVQGVSYENESAVSRNTTNKTFVSGAIAKGKFTRNVFQGDEGNQGPYRLRGANNEFFFIVLANTERVFINGELLQRGEDQDYVINYNTAEITFTPRRFITKDSRIQVEFEYSDRNYLNSLLYLNNETIVNKKLKINLGVYSNSDAKSSPINQILDPNQKRFLNQVGDSVQSAFYPTATVDTFQTDKILYAKVDTSYAGVSSSIYVYSTNKDSAKYSLGFLEVGQSRGNYIPIFNGANGKVYRWVQPVNGVPAGNFEPATYLVTPKKQQLYTFSSVYDINSKTQLQAEMALSNYDVNLFSEKHKTDNKGLGGKLLLNHNAQLSIRRGKSLNFSAAAAYEWVQKNFRPIERLRAVEFYRDWGLDFLPQAATEHLPVLTLGLKDQAANALTYQLSGYFRSDQYSGVRHLLQQNQKIGGWDFRNVVSLTAFETATTRGRFTRPTVEVSKVFKKLGNYAVGGGYALESNIVRANLRDTLTPLSFAFQTISAYLKSDESKDNRWSFTYFTRSDKLPSRKNLVQTDRSHNFNLGADLRSNPNHQLRLNLSYRLLEVFAPGLTSLKPDNSMLGRVEYSINEWKGFVVGNVLYELGAGQEQRRDFAYFEVPAGRGEFAWIDYNADGIQQLNEFEIALFPDQAKFIRIYTPTNTFVKANYTQVNYSITLNPRALAGNIRNKRFKEFVGRFNLQSTLQTAKKELAGGKILFDPFKGGITDTSLITLNSVFANTLSFNRFGQKWGLDVSNANNFNKALLTYGFESRKLSEWIFKARWNVARQYTMEVVQRVGNNSLFTPRFANRNYELNQFTAEPRLTFVQGTKFRLQSGYQFARKKNLPEYGGELSKANALNLETKYNSVNNTSLGGRFTFSNISYTGAVNNTISYIMLEGLQPGKNFLWNLELTKRLGNNLELNLNYEGRKPAAINTIHIGRVSVRALL
ncbi:hypothetical protein EXU57_08710 [Segetibacter sp. 3557_3]|nr:hypothetical protein EXU57_08710 [Segetibacter sp. 3557_3]